MPPISSIFLFLLLLLPRDVLAYDVLMVAGGYYHQGGQDHFLSNVEVIGRNSSCEVAALPEPRIGLTLARLKRTVVACGGFYIYERSDCFTYFPRLGRWIHNLELNSSSVFHSSAGEGNSLFVAGGRRFDHSAGEWSYSDEVWRYSARRRAWRRMPDLQQPIADACMVAVGGNLVLTGGSKGKYLYADEPGKAQLLRRRSNSWNATALPEMLGNRMWHACTITEVEGEVGLVIVGGYYLGMATMFLPLSALASSSPTSPDSGWRWLASLPAERKWGTALGSVDGILTAAGGKNYGDDTLDELVGGLWVTSGVKKLLHKREFAAHATVSSEWFPNCRFDGDE